ncbi:MAG: acyl-CoA synthetase FdrA [Pseudomonadota bacterium]|nr:acyl-CoA synthetase FdrA [Pseudomonadota bacterium]
MPSSSFLKKNLYKDSVALMRIAQTVLSNDGVERATLLMGSAANKAILGSAGLSNADLDAAKPGDVMVVVQAATAAGVDAAVAQIDDLLEGARDAAAAGSAVEQVPRSISAGYARIDDARLVQISVPGPYAAAEAMKALRQGLHVFLFSDNVPLEQERSIKTLARKKGLLVMGPDCGTAIVSGTPLGFANVVKRGDISLVGASGTGLQEVSCQIDALGHGIRHAIGTGGHDVSAEIGGSTLCQALELLEADAGTKVICIVSKPPAPAVAQRVLQQVASFSKPVVVLFLGADLRHTKLPAHVTTVGTLRDAAAAAVALAEGRPFEPASQDEGEPGAIDAAIGALAPGQQAVRGLYSGGTFCSEAKVLWGEMGLHLSAVESTQAVPGAGHLAVDLGDDMYTVGRPHPMIDPGMRVERFAHEARDPEVAVIVLDVVLGYAGHADPAGALAPVIREAKAASAKAGRGLIVVSFVCGTEADPQVLSKQRATLREAGAWVLPSSSAAARLAGRIGLRLSDTQRDGIGRAP